ncbi:MAG: hypothetical protein JL50_08595 [Peptococcaceae bacterium BICA1-7]|nr:MAG: hypothetical protein JL50_08595 [Peptococcaceae bacterium BICA1-7]HBV97378.1 hypothetical protein [Desulfotomaculum sp.]
MRVEFPSDVREDIHVLGIQLKDLLLFFIPSVILGIICFAIPFPVAIRFVLALALPAGTFLWLFFDMPALCRRRRIFKKDPDVRTSAEGDNNIHEIITVSEVEGPFVTTDDQCLHICLSVTTGPWLTKIESERDQSGLVWQQVVGRVLSQGCLFDTWAINDLEVLNPEMDRQKKEQAQLPEELQKIGRDRREYWTFLGTSGFSRTVSYYLRISADPFELEFNPKPKSKIERFDKTKQLLVELAGDVIQKLRSSGDQAVVISGEVLRDVAARQLQPQDYRDGAVRGSDWVRPGGNSIKRKVEKKAPVIQDPGRERKLPARPAEPVEGKATFRWLMLLYKATLLLRKLWPLYSNSVYVVSVLHSGDDETPGLAMVINELYAGFDTVYNVPMVYRGDDSLNEDAQKALRTGYVYFVVPNPDDWSDEELTALTQDILAEAERYGSRVDIALQYPDGLASQLIA